MATLVACNQSGSVFKIDESTGVGSLVGSTGFIGTNSLARDDAGTLYSVPGPLITIDPTTGVGTLKTNVTPPTDVRGLAFSPTNALFAIRYGGPVGSIDGPDDLVTIDVATGGVKLVGPTGFNGIQALEFSPSGTLYGWDLKKGLVTIDPGTGAATLVNPGSPPPPGVDIQSLAFSPNGTLYGAREVLYRVDTSTGATTLVGSGGYTDVRGIEFLKAAVGRPNVHIPHYAWAWMILVGYILITPIGPLCIACGNPLSGDVIRILGAVTLGVGGMLARRAFAGR